MMPATEELTLRPATTDDLPVLTALNQQLIEDQRHDNPRGPAQLEQRMRRWLSGAYRVGLFESAGTSVAYAVWREDEDGVYVRQFFVAREHRRLGVGRRAIALLEGVWRDREVTLNVLLDNEPAMAFYRSLGFEERSIVLRRRAGSRVPSPALDFPVSEGLQHPDEPLPARDASLSIPARSLSLHAPHRRLPAVRLRTLLGRVDEHELPDDYGRGSAVHRLECRVAELLGKETSVLMPTGTMASQVALRLHADVRGTRLVGFHPRAHVEVHERKGYAVVHALTGLPLGDHDRLLRLSDLEAVKEQLAAVLWELPQRDIGGVLPEWGDLVAQTRWASEHAVARHLDGARLWEAQPYYGRSHAEIASLFDTVYVSLYKGLEGIAGALLAGPTALVEQAREWRARLGGQLHQAWPLAMAAEVGLDSVLPRMQAFWDRANDLAVVLRDISGVELVPDPPQTPLFHVHVHASKDALERAHADIIRDLGVGLFLYARTTGNPARSAFEMVVGENVMAVDVAEVRDLVADLAGRAQQLDRH